jgi:hypothetical protein
LRRGNGICSQGDNFYLFFKGCSDLLDEGVANTAAHTVNDTNLHITNQCDLGLSRSHFGFRSNAAVRTIYYNCIAEQEKTSGNGATVGWDGYPNCSTTLDLKIIIFGSLGSDALLTKIACFAEQHTGKLS